MVDASSQRDLREASDLVTFVETCGLPKNDSLTMFDHESKFEHLVRIRLRGLNYKIVV